MMRVMMMIERMIPAGRADDSPTSRDRVWQDWSEGGWKIVSWYEEGGRGKAQNSPNSSYL